MFITAMKTRNCNEKSTMDTWSKRTQTNPTCSELACPELACGELVEPVEGVEPILLYVEAVREFFERAARAFGVGSAKFFAESYQERVKLIEKPRFLWQV
jgi:hypothetical protein